MNNAIPYVATSTGDVEEAPAGSIPIRLFGVSSESGGGNPAESIVNVTLTDPRDGSSYVRDDQTLGDVLSEYSSLVRAAIVTLGNDLGGQINVLSGQITSLTGEIENVQNEMRGRLESAENRISALEV